MAHHSDTRKDIFKIDANRDTFKVGETLYDGEVVHHPPEFPAVDTILRQLKWFEPRRDDVLLLSYSKTGTHWLYEILGILLSNKLETLKNFKGEAMIEKNVSLSMLEDIPSPRVLNTHMLVKYIPKTLTDNHKAVCIIRNPKSVAVSYYHHTIFQENFYEYRGNFVGYLPVFIAGYHNLYGNWFESTLGYWNEFRNNKNVYFVFYEELIKNPAHIIKDISDFLGLDRSFDFCAGVAELTSFKKMVKAEGKPVVDDLNHRFRKGTVTDWKNLFTVRQNEEFDQIYREKMKDNPELIERIIFQ